MNGDISLPSALSIAGPKELVGFTGAGGKTSLLIALARELKGRVIITTTTRLFAAQVEDAARALPADIFWYPDLPNQGGEEKENYKILVIGPVVEDKVTGVPISLPGELITRSDVDFVLVEADGAKRLPVKAPAAHEPALPQEVTLVVPAAGIDALGQPIEKIAHRPNLLAALLGKGVGESLTAADLAALFGHVDGGLKGVPPTARVVPVINKVETPEQLRAARQIARLVLKNPRIAQVVLTKAAAVAPVVEVHKRVTAVILAAGQSQRMGKVKLTLPWADSTVLGQTIRNLKMSAVDDILVVCGHKADVVEEIARAEGARTVFNPDYEAGEMISSLQTAVAQMPAQVSAILVMLGDQPLVEPATINQLLEAYWQGKGQIIAPQFANRRGNPVLFDRRHFAELTALPAGSAPRDLLRRHEVHLVPVASDAILVDIDLPEDYDKHRPA